MQQVIAADHFGVRVREKGKDITLFSGEIARRLRRIDADRRHPNAVRLELAPMLLDTPQLGVAGWSPIPAVKHQQRTLRSRSMQRVGQQ